MVKKEIISIETVIIGGGFSGLFLADSFIYSGYTSFLLLERHQKNLGGYSIMGDIKVSLLPAGEKTKNALQNSRYEMYAKRFLEKFDKFLIKPSQDTLEINIYVAGLQNKFYNSYILPKRSAKKLITSLLKAIEYKLLFIPVNEIKKHDNEYLIILKNSLTIKCKNIIIATGRDPTSVAILKKIGQSYINKHDLLFGCRATFDSKLAEKLYMYQPDFRLKDKNNYQTYCFNYKGRIYSYYYKGYKIYSGTLNENCKMGNCFVGRKRLVKPEFILSKINKPFTIDLAEFIKLDWPKSLEQDFLGLCKFIDKLEKNFGLKIKKLFFPALEQFWPKPILKLPSLESNSLPNVFYIGDSSGISYGFLQCYITANLLSEHFRKNNDFH